jgi:hypothetical protein
MLTTHYLAIARLGRDRTIKYLVRDYFGLPRAPALMPALLSCGLGQADLVLCLLRVRDAHAGLRTAAEAHIAALVGHPIVVGVPCLMGYRRAPVRPEIAQNPSPRIAWVSPENPRLPRTEAYLRWCEYRVGRTEAQLRSRGITRRDFRKAVRRGWVRMEATS